MRATMAATASSRMRSARRPSIRTMPSDRNVPSTATTWPWGRARRMVTAASSDGNTTPPARAARMASTRAGGIFERLARVLLRMRLPSRQASRRRMAGGEERLGMISMLMAKAESLHGNNGIGMISY